MKTIREQVNGSSKSDLKYQKAMLAMGIIFTLVGAYRTVFVSEYGPQQAWFNTIANSSLIIRILAIFAEISFAGLIAYAMLKFNEYVPPSKQVKSNKFRQFIETKSPYMLITCIFIAQFFATTAVITKFELLFTIEETLWSIGFLSILPLAIIQLKRILSIKDPDEIKRLRLLKYSAIIITVWTIVYCAYGLLYHLPSMWIEEINRWQTGYPSIQTGGEAIINALTVITVTRQYSDWGFGFFLWHSTYFSVCVWISLFLMQAPRPTLTEQANTKVEKIVIYSITAAIIILLVLITLPLLL